MTKRIRITGREGRLDGEGSGIFGMPTDANPSGEYPIGHEFDTDADLPAGWLGRAVVVGEEPAPGSVLVGNDDDDERVVAARREVADEAQKFIDNLRAEHATALQAETDRADALQARVTELEKEAAARGPDPELIKAAIEGLDPKNDEHWTKAGLPEVAAIKEALGADVTRAQIEAAAPDAKRPTE